MSIYTDNGYKSRADYLRCLAADYGVRIEVVYAIAELYGPIEDFDALVTSVQDASQEQTD